MTACTCARESTRSHVVIKVRPLGPTEIDSLLRDSFSQFAAELMKMEQLDESMKSLDGIQILC